MTRALIFVGLIVVCAVAPGAAHASDLPITNSDDAGAGSLRATMAAANTGDTVVIPAGIGTITLTSGQIPVTKDLTIRGAGRSSTVISGNNASRVFCVRTPACPAPSSAATQPSLTVTDLTITAGKLVTKDSVDGGGGIYIDRGELTLARVKMTANSVTFANKVVAGGGAVYNSRGKTTITDSTLANNTVTGGPGAVAIDGGGAVHTEVGPLTITNSHIDGNKVTLDSGPGTSVNGGGGVLVDGGVVTITDSTIDGNRANVDGSGGVLNGGAGLYLNSEGATLTRTSVDDNALNVSDPTGGQDGGGGVFSLGGKLTLTGSTVRGNAATLGLDANGGKSGGAGIYAATTISAFTDSTLAGNVLSLTAEANSQANGGGAFYANGGSWELTRTTVGPNNVASLTVGAGSTFNGGGAIFSAADSGKLTDATVAQNQLVSAGPGTEGGGGGVFHRQGNETWTNATVVGNSHAGVGGGVRSVAGTVTFKNSLIAANRATDAFNCGISGTAVLETKGNNLESANTCGLGPTELRNTNVVLGRLDNYGGPTQTLALLAGSPPIGKGDNAACSATDQRGVARPKGTACDIGAYEFAPPDVVTGGVQAQTTVSGTVNPNLRRATAFFEFGPTTAYGSQTATQDVGDGNAPAQVIANLPGLPAGTTMHYRLVATNGDGTSVGNDATFTTDAAPAPPALSPPGSTPGSSATDGTPVTTAGAGPTAATTRFAGVQLKRLVLVAKGKRASVPIFCPVGQCTGSIALRRSGVALGSARFTIADGKTANVSVRLTPAAGRLLRKKPSLRALASLTATSNGQTRQVSAKVALKRKRRR